MQHQFWIAAVSRPILGCDFFLAHNLVIDVPRRRLIGAQEVFHATEEPMPAIHGIHAPPQGPFEKILAEFPELLVQDYKKSV